MKFIRGIKEDEIINMDLVKSMSIYTNSAEYESNFYLHVKLTEEVEGIRREEYIYLGTALNPEYGIYDYNVFAYLNGYLCEALNTESTVIDFTKLFYIKAIRCIRQYAESPFKYKEYYEEN